MSRTNRTFRWARCPRPDCGERVYVNADHAIEDADCECGEQPYTDEEMDEMYANMHEDYDSDYDRLRDAEEAR